MWLITYALLASHHYQKFFLSPVLGFLRDTEPRVGMIQIDRQMIKRLITRIGFTWCRGWRVPGLQQASWKPRRADDVVTVQRPAGSGPRKSQYLISIQKAVGKIISWLEGRQATGVLSSLQGGSVFGSIRIFTRSHEAHPRGTRQICSTQSADSEVNLPFTDTSRNV